MNDKNPIGQEKCGVEMKVEQVVGRERRDAERIVPHIEQQDIISSSDDGPVLTMAISP